MSKKSFAELKAQFKKQQEDKKDGNKKFAKNNDVYPFWTMNDGEECIVRILPNANPETDDDNPFPISIEYLENTLYIDNKMHKIPSLANWGEDDPIGALSQKYYKAGDKTKGKKYWRNAITILRALVIKDPLPVDTETGESAEGKVKTLRFGFQLKQALLAAIASDELDIEPWDLEKGFNFRIKKTATGKDEHGKEQFSYAIGSGFVRNPSDVSELVKDKLVDLKTLLPPNPGREKVERLLDSHLTGSTYSDADDTDSDSEDDGTETDTAPVASKTVTKAETKTESKDIPDSEDNSSDSEDDDIIAQIRRRKASKA